MKMVKLKNEDICYPNLDNGKEYLTIKRGSYFTLYNINSLFSVVLSVSESQLKKDFLIYDLPLYKKIKYKFVIAFKNFKYKLGIFLDKIRYINSAMVGVCEDNGKKIIYSINLPNRKKGEIILRINEDKSIDVLDDYENLKNVIEHNGFENTENINKGIYNLDKLYSILKT